MPALKAELPDYLYWLTEKVESLVKPAAYLVKDKGRVAPQGSTRAGWGYPDVPADASWGRYPGGQMPRSWVESPYDGESFWLQLNLEEIPPAVRKEDWPAAGVVWLFLDLSGDRWTTTVHFDPRPAASIKWRPRPVSLERPAAEMYGAVRWVAEDTLLCATEATLPEIFCVDHMCSEFDEWVCEHYGHAPSDVQVGGWVWPCQGDHDHRNLDFVCGFSRQNFGDSGAVYLHYNAEQGFYGMAETH